MPANQLLISTYDTNEKKYFGHTYEVLIERIKTIGNPKRLAQKVLTCLNNHAQSECLSQLNLTQEQKNAVFEFIALTQTGESGYGQDRRYSRTPSMNKFARKILKDISDEKMSIFEKKCDWDLFTLTSVYPCAGGGGTGNARALVVSNTPISIISPYVSEDAMSDDSDG
jgi:hypothetical protein